MSSGPDRAIGIDPGSIRTGFGIVERSGSDLRCIGSGVIECGRMDFTDRLMRIYDGIREQCERFEPSTAAIEGLFHHRNSDSALKLGHTRGVAILALKHAGLDVTEYAPTLVKKRVVGYGRADKRQVQSMVTMLLGKRDFDAFDESDAVAIAICHVNSDPRFPSGTL